MRSLFAVILSAVLLFSVAGCSGDKKADQTLAKTATIQEVKKEAPKEKTAFIVGTEVNAREKASIDSGIVGTYDLGEKVTILADEGEWAKVKRADGQECYVFKKYLGTQEDLDKRAANNTVKKQPVSNFELGGLIPSNTPTHVKNIYGEPTVIKNGIGGKVSDPRAKTFFYGDSFSIGFFESLVIQIKSTANNGITTPSGIHVGSTVEEVKKAFGAPGKLPLDLRNRTDVLRYTDEPYSRELLFTIKNGKVVEIELNMAEAY